MVVWIVDIDISSFHCESTGRWVELLFNSHTSPGYL